VALLSLKTYLIDVVVKELTPFWTVNYGPQSAVIAPNIGVWGQPLRNFSIYRRMPSAVGYLTNKA